MRRYGDDEVEEVGSSHIDRANGRSRVADNGSRRRHRGVFSITKECSDWARRKAEGRWTEGEKLAHNFRAPPAHNTHGRNRAAHFLDREGVFDGGVFGHIE